MRLPMRMMIVLVMATCAGTDVRAQEGETDLGHREWWNEGYGRRRSENPQAKQLPLIRVEGNRFVNPEGKTVLFRGLAISDPDKIEKQGHWNETHFDHVKEMGAMVVRLPVHPVAWRERTPQKYLELLDEAVAWCTELEMYVIIDWHSIGNLETELFQQPMYDTSKQETFQFWRTISRHFSGHNTVAFYELFNEPTTYREQLGRISWSRWKELNENMISIIRAFDTETIPLVAGFDWAYDLTPLLIEPIAAVGIGYITHPYPMKRSRPWPPKWEENFGFAAEKYPIIASEIGFGLRGEEKVDEDHYGRIIVDYLEGKGISWIAWVYDPNWGPPMLKSWDYDLTGAGAYWKEALHGLPAEARSAPSD